MDESPFFSIIIPTYNRASLLPKAINSVIAQTFNNWELLIINDGSTDNTEELVQAYADARIKYIYQDNAERSAARNNGINHARGQYICFLDSDDYYLDDHLQKAYEVIKSAGLPEAVFVTDVIRDENGICRKVEHEPISNYPNPVCFILCSAESVIPARVIIHRNILSKYKFNPTLKISEDAELLTRIGANYPFIQIPYHTVAYCLHESNSTNTNNNPYPLQLIALKLIFNNKMVNKFIPLSIKNQKLSNCYFGIAKYYHFKQQYFNMSVFLLKSLLLFPSSPSSKTKIYMIVKHFPHIFKSNAAA